MIAASYSRRKTRNGIWTVLAYAATALGLAMLAIILVTLLWNGLGGLSLDVFTKNTAPPGVVGGLLNSSVGSVIMTGIGLALGAPIGILAGTYLAEYGANSRLASVVRFINDILLSAPSIIIGLFVYELLVAPVGHFSALAGAVALAMLGAPIMVRTTEDMLNLAWQFAVYRRSSRADVGAAAHHLRIRSQPLRGTTKARVDRRAYPDLCG